MTADRIQAAFTFSCAFALAMALAMLASRASAAEPAPPRCDRPAASSDPDPLVGFRCASEANLRAMIAEPEDLERGRVRAPDAGDAAFAAADRHRHGQPKPLASEATGPQPIQIEGKFENSK